MIKNKKQTSIFDQMVSFDIKLKIQETFNEQFFKKYSSNFFLEIYDVIVYEKKKQSFDIKMFDCINDTISYYDYLQNNILSYSEIENYSKNLLSQKKIIDEEFQFLSKFAEHNESIVFMGQIFLEAFDQQSQSILSFFQEHVRKDRIIYSQFQQQESINPSDGVVFCSLLDKGYRITQHSSSFISLLNLNHQNIVNYDITSFLPTEKNIMEDLIYSLRNSNKKLSVLNERDRFGFGINERSQIINLNISTKIQYLNDEVGICILVKQVNTYNNYLLISKHNQILGITKHIQDQIDDIYNSRRISNKYIIYTVKLLIQDTLKNKIILKFQYLKLFFSMIIQKQRVFVIEKIYYFKLKICIPTSQILLNQILNLKFKSIIQSKVGANVEDHIPCLKYFDYEVGKDFVQNTIFVVDKKHKQTDLTPLLKNKHAKQKYDQYFFFDIIFKFISIKLDAQNVQFNYLEILDFKLVQREHEISTKINQLKNLIENPQLMQMDKTKFIGKLVDSKILVDTKFCAETKYFGETKSFGDDRNDSFDGNTNFDRYQSESKHFQSMSEKKSSYNAENQNYQTSPQQLTQKTTIFQRAESTYKEQSPKYLSTLGQNMNDFKYDDFQLQSPRITENQMNDLNILSTRDFRSARQILEPTQQDFLNKQTEQIFEEESSHKRSQEISQSMSNFGNEQIQKVVSNKGSSLNSQSSNYKSRIPKRIKQKRMSCNLQYFTMIGILSLCLLIVVNWVVFQISRDGITRYQQQFKTISNPMAMYMKSLDLLRQISYFYLMRRTDPSIKTQEERDYQMEMTQIEQQNILQSFKNDFYNLIEAESNNQLLEYLTSITMEISEMIDLVSVSYIDYIFYKQPSNLLLTLKDYLTASFNMVLFVDDNRELVMWENMILFKQKIFIFQEYMKEDMVQVLDQCQINNFIALVIVISSSFFLMVVVLIVIYIQQMQKKKILKLLGCFTPDILSTKSDRLEELILQYKQRYIFNTRRRKSLVFDNQSNKNTVNSRSRNYNNCKKDFINKMKKNHVYAINQNYGINTQGNTENFISNQTENQNYISNQTENQTLNKQENSTQNKEEEYKSYQTENQTENKTNKQKQSVLRSTIRKQSQYNDKKSNYNKKMLNTIKKENYANRKRDTTTKSFIMSQKKISEIESSNSNKRKRIQANFDQYRPLKLIHFVLGFIILFNIIIFEPYQIEQKWLIDEKLKIYDLAAIVIQNAAPQVLNLEWLWRNGDSLNSVYFRFIKSQKEENEQKLLLVKTLANPIPFTLNDENEYKNFYLPMLTGDICQTRKNYPQYVNTNFTYEFCLDQYEGILTKGFLFTISKAYYEVDSIQQIYIHYDKIVYNVTRLETKAYYSKHLINGHNLIDINSILKYINESIISICIYYHNTSKKYTEKILDSFFTLFIIQNIIVYFTVISIWVVINKQLKRDMKQAKLYFTLFNVRLLSTNSHLNQYFSEFSQ